MAMVSFKRGLHQNLPSTAVDGVFYLTTDTNRLYVGNADGNFVDLNKYIKNVASIEEAMALPNKKKDDFVYISGGNIFAVYNGENWVQVNTNTNDDTSVSDLAAVTERVTEEDGKKVKITLTLSQSKVGVDGLPYPEENQPEDITTSFYITQEDFSALVEGAAIDVTTEEVEGGVKIKTVGTGSAGDGFELVAGTNVVIAKNADSDKVTVSAKDTTYNLLSNESDKTISFVAKVDGVADATTAEKVTFASGNKLEVAVAENNTVTYSHATTDTDTTPVEAEAPKAGETITVIKTVETDAYGHVTKAAPVTITLPEDKDTTYGIDSVTADDKGAFSVALTKSVDGGVTVEKLDAVSSGEVLYNYVGKDGKIKVLNQGNLNVYTIEEIDEKIAGLNALLYQGPVNRQEELPGIGLVEYGNMYMIAEAGAYPIGPNGADVVCEVGDLIIARGTQDSDGIITGDLVWDYIPAGDDVDTQYSLFVNDKTIYLKNSVDSSSSDAVKFVAGTNISISDEWDAEAKTGTFTVNHETISTDTSVNTTENATFGGTIKVVDSVEAGTNGHVTKITTKEITLPTPVTQTLDVAQAEANKKATVSLNGTGLETTSVDLVAGKDLTVSVSEDEVTFNHAIYSNNETDKFESGSIEDKETNGNYELTVIKEIATSNGHVTGVTTDVVSFKDTRHSLSSAVKAVDNVVTISNVLGNDNGLEASTGEISLASESLVMTVSESTVNVELEWGSFNS